MAFVDPPAAAAAVGDAASAKKGPLLLACFHVLWMKECVRAISVAKELATVYPACKFCSVPADTLELLSVSRKYKVEQFPTFILFRAGQELERVTGTERVAEQIVRMLNQHITEEDVARYEAKKRQREAEELKLSQELGLAPPSHNQANAGEDGGENGQIEWVWDVDGTGQSMRIEDLGMSISLRGEEDNEEEVVWEYSIEDANANSWDEVDNYGSRWIAFGDDLQVEIERQYRMGALYKDENMIEMEASVERDISRGLQIWQSDVVVKSDLVTGLFGEFTDDVDSDEEEDNDAFNEYGGDDGDKQMVVRRRGPRYFPIPGEPEQSEMQKRIDESMAKYRASEKRRRRLFALQRRGRDVEAARGTAGLTPNSGIHRWELKWMHEPSRGGKGDAVGLASENFERFGPCKEPCLGGDEELCSIALYATGEVFHGRKQIAQTKFQRVLPEEEDKLEEEEEETGDLKLDDRVSVRVENEEFTGRIAFVNPNNTFAVIFDEDESTNKSVGYGGGVDYAVRAEDITKLEPESTKPAPCWGRNSRVAVVFDTDFRSGSGLLTFEIDGTMLEDVAVEGVFNKLGGGALYPAICLAPFPKTLAGVTGATTVAVQQTEHEEEEEEEEEEESEAEELTAEEAAAKERALLEEKAVKQGITPQEMEGKSNRQVNKLIKERIALTQPPKFPSVLLLGDDKPQSAAPAAAGSRGEKKKKKKKHKATRQEQDDATAAEAAAAESEEEESEEAEEIPIERCVWMWETEDGWEQYPKDVSAQLETARRANKQELQVRVQGRAFTVRLVGAKDGATEPEQKSDTGETCKVRRHVVSEGLRGQWELLSLKFSMSTRPLRGNTALEILNKVWTGAETMNGRNQGMGFLFLYTLLQGQLKVKIVSSWSDYSSMYVSGAGGGGGMYGGGGGMYGGGYSNYYSMDRRSGGYGLGASSGGGSAASSDSHRFATLLAQLYADRRTKSVMSSIVNVLVRNKQLCTRMPKLKDTRKTKKTPVFNAWVDEREPRSPLADLFNHIVPTLQKLKTKRGTIQFPPKPPHPELAPSATECARAIVLPAGVPRGERAWLRPELTDFACSSRALEPCSVDEIADLSIATLHRVSVRQGEPPAEVEDEDEFWEEIKQVVARRRAEEEDDLVVVLFHAKWCPSCATLAPVFRSTALRTPVVRFIKVDVDDCDKLASQFEVQKLPHTVYLQARAITPNATRQEIKASVVGGGPRWVVEFDKILDQLLSEQGKLALVQHRNELSGAIPPERSEALAQAEAMATLGEEIDRLATWPSEQVASPVLVVRNRSEMGKPPISSLLPFDISGHEASVTAVAESMLQRMKEDVVHHARAVNSGTTPSLRALPEEMIKAFFAAESSIDDLARARDELRDLLQALRKSRDADARMVSQALPLLTKAANHVDLSVDREERIEFLLRRQSGQEPTVWLEFLYGALLSSQAEQDLLKLNPYLMPNTVASIFKLTSTAVLRANRLGHTNRCIAAAIRLDELLTKALQVVQEDERQALRSTLQPRVIQSAETLAGLLSTKRHYVSTTAAGSRMYDPRFMVFEFVWNLCLRQKQIEIVDMFRNNLAMDVSKVKQMIMGAGKTTVVAPLLALCLSDGKSLVLSVVPKALLEMSRTLMRETFAAIMNKRVYTLRFDRSTKVHPGMRRTLENARMNRGIVVATPTTVKSIMLSYIESLEHLQLAREGNYSYEPVDVVAKRCSELGGILQLFSTGVMLLDEVDLILHPLKSELNFPKGEKFDLDVSENGERWGLPIHLLDAIFYAQSGRVTTFEARGASFDIIRRLEQVVREGYENRSLQRLPHLTLLNPNFYSQRMKPILAEWAFLWIQKEHLHGIDREEAVRYMLTGAASRSEGKAKETLLESALQQAAAGSSDSARLATALDKARVSQTLTDSLYEAEEQLESFLSASAQAIADLDAEIAQITRAIKEAENPRDDSLDNAVIVWYSPAFAPSHSAQSSPSKLASLRALGALCAELESAGFTVKRCDQTEEAGARVRELQSNGHLRCVIVGGGEGVVGCSPDCDETHHGACLVCNQHWGSHSGHTCSSGARGSWPDGDDEDGGNEEQNEAAAENVAFVETLFSKVGQVPLPSARVALFGGHATLAETLRMSFWKLQVYVADDDAKLQAWCDQLPEWSVGGDKD